MDHVNLLGASQSTALKAYMALSRTIGRENWSQVPALPHRLFRTAMTRQETRCAPQRVSVFFHYGHPIHRNWCLLGASQSTALKAYMALSRTIGCENWSQVLALPHQLFRIARTRQETRCAPQRVSRDPPCLRAGFLNTPGVDSPQEQAYGRQFVGTKGGTIGHENW